MFFLYLIWPAHSSSVDVTSIEGYLSITLTIFDLFGLIVSTKVDSSSDFLENIWVITRFIRQVMCNVK